MEKLVFGSNIPGYVIGAKNLPAVIVMQEWWGINDSIKQLATKISEQGFRCLVPDIYKGKSTVEAEEAHHLMSNLDFPKAVEEIREAAQYLKSTGSPKVFITGFCMGGALSFAAAQHVKELSAAVPFYGIPDARYFQIDQIKIPVQAHFGKEDALAGFSDPTASAEAEKKMKAAGCDVEFHNYDGLSHAFMNGLVPAGVEQNKRNFGGAPDEAILQPIFERMVAFLKKHSA